SDGDGKRDLIEVYIRRPFETEKGMKVPVIYIANPYMMGTKDDLYKTHNVDADIMVFEETDISLDEIRYTASDENLPLPRKVMGRGSAQRVTEDIEFEALSDWYNYFLVRGYAIVFAGGIGTKGSEGVRTCGSTEETVSTISVIDWLNGRVRGFSNRTDNVEVKSFWSDGKVGMTGKSYLGTLAIAAASTGVEGLRTIVPQAAISNWYEYYRCNGLNAPALGWQGDDADLLAQYCMSRISDSQDYNKVREHWEKSLEQIRSDQDRETGNYNRFWDERNYLNNAGSIKASVFIEHGLRDWNVKPKQFDMLWKELEKHDVPRKMILHQGDHIYINNMSGIEYNDIMNRWYGYWLYDIENDIMDEYPQVIIQNNLDTSVWEGSESWPFEGTCERMHYIDENGRLSDYKSDYHSESVFVDDVSITGFDREKPQDTSKWAESVAGNPEEHRPFRLTFIGDCLSEKHRISGTIKLKLKASLDRETGIISAMLIDYGCAKRPVLEKTIIKKQGILYGKNAGSDDIVNFVIEKNPSDYRIITRGWMSAQNRRNNYNKDKIVPGEFYDFEFEMQPADYNVPKRHRIGLVIYSTDAEVTSRPFLTTKFKILDNSIELVIPMRREGIK
ncbi:MAG: Xaa-Pro dipeptidyl-peptidase, partial [Proteocatella sp.]